MKLRPSLPEESWRARLRQFAPIALAALAPKGVCCLAAYAASGALFGRELCGGAETSTIVALLPWLGGVLGGGAFWLWRHSAFAPVSRHPAHRGNPAATSAETTR